MKNYDIIIIGGGSGGIVMEEALRHGLNVALVNKEPPGGTCMNFGCIPTKKIIYPADRIMEIRESEKLGIRAEIREIRFHEIMKRMRKDRKSRRDRIKKNLKETENLDYYNIEGHFIDNYTLEVNDEKISGEKIVIANGARPFIPPVKGLNQADYHTNESILELNEPPTSMIIIGGGYIAVEIGHFLSAIGCNITILQRAERIIPNLEPEISELLRREMQKRMNIVTGTEAVEVNDNENGKMVKGLNKETSEETDYTAEDMLVATGRKSNADILKVENTGVEIDSRGYIKVNEYMETNVQNIWAMGDATGKFMFKHVANNEAALIANNILHEEKTKMDYSAVPYAVFSYPEVAGVGLTEEKAKKDHKILVGRANYSNVAMGKAMMEKVGFAKAIVNREDFKILGFHIIGPQASILIQEVINLAANHMDIMGLSGMHIHPALPELVINAINNLEPV